MSSRKTEVTKIDLRNKTRERLVENVAREAPVNLYVNDEHVTTILASPTKLREFVLGFLVGEGIIRSADDVKDIWIKDLDAKVQTISKVQTRVKAYHITRVITTTCGSVEAYLSLLDRMDKPKVTSKLTVAAQNIRKMIEELNRKSLDFRTTGATHASAIFIPGCKQVSFCEDVGRHNAVDKAIGEALLSSADLS
ncbi:MAG: formate dehydrogenase accessory sulfurtransferase FdhD, partial [Candidatus Bathyarchaeota archaeon]